MEVNNRMSKNLTKFAERLRALRGTRSQMEMAAFVGGITQAAWAQWEMGARQPKLDVFAHICKQLGVTADWLIGIDDTQPTPKPSIDEQLALLKAQLGETSKSMEGIMAQISRLEKERGKP